jgi:hypothetical protein
LPWLCRLCCEPKRSSERARIGFHWPNARPVFDKLKEEIAKLAERRALEDEMGDILFCRRQPRPEARRRP